MRAGTMYKCDVCGVTLYPNDTFHGKDEVGREVEGCLACMRELESGHNEQSITRPLCLQADGFMLRFDPYRAGRKWTAVAPNGRLGDYEAGGMALAAIIQHVRMN